MSTSPPALRGAGTAAGAAFIPTIILLELFGGLIQGWITPLLGVISHEYHVSGGAVSWILTVGLLSSAVSVPLLTILSDRFGARRMLVTAAVFSALGSVLIALAPNFPLLLLGSIVQGPVAALLPIEMSLLKHHRPQQAGRIIGLLVGSLTFGIAMGGLVSGFLLESTGSLVLTQLIGAIPLVILALLLRFTVPFTPSDPGRVVDWAGAGVFGIVLIGIMIGLSSGPSAGWGAPATLLALGIGLVAIIVFVIVESRAHTPLFDVKLLRAHNLTIPLLLGVFMAMPLFGAQTPTVLFLGTDPQIAGYGTGTSTSSVGLILAIVSLAATVGSFVGPWAKRLMGARATIVVTALIMAVSTAALVTGVTSVVVATMLFAIPSLGGGILMAVLPDVVLVRAPAEAAASVSGLYNTGRSLGGSVAGAVIAAIMAGFATVPDGAVAATPFAAFQTIWIMLAAVCVVLALLALLLRTPAQAETTAYKSPFPAAPIGADS